MDNYEKNKFETITLFELTSIISLLDKYPDMKKECEKELLTLYYEARKIAKITGDWNVEVSLENKDNLKEFIKHNIKNQKNSIKYKNLSSACHYHPKIQLYTNEKSETLQFDEKRFVKKHPEGGFVEKFCLSKEEQKKVKLYRRQSQHKDI